MTTLQSRQTTSDLQADATSPQRVLLVEDDHDTCSGIRVRLSFEGYEVFSANEGRNAVSLVQKVVPDVVLLDLGLPGADGFEVLTRLHSIRPSLPVIVVSAWEESQYESRCLDRGAVMFLQKPIAGEQLAAAVRSVLERE